MTPVFCLPLLYGKTGVADRIPGHRAITQRIDANITDMRPRIVDIQFSHILDILKPINPPELALQKVQSFTKRGQLLSIQFRESEDLTKSFNAWLSQEGSSLFVVQVGPRSEFKAKEFTASVIEFLRTTEYAVFWNISQLAAQSHPASLNDIMASLVYQALKHNPAALCNNLDQVNIAKFQESHTEAEWRALLLNIFSQMAECFVIVEAHDLFLACREDPGWTSRFIQVFQDLADQAARSSRSLKILVMNYDKEHLKVEAENRITSAMPAPTPVPPHLRRRLGRIRGNSQFSKLHPRF
jgi:hypothetical protein